MMRIHTLQHVPFEDSACIVLWAAEKKYTVSHTRFFAGDTMPGLDGIDWLVIMGGPMNIYEEHTYPWLEAEKKYIAGAISAGKTVLGVCLGAQLIADVLGGRVYRNRYREIGWFPVSLTDEGKQSGIWKGVPETFTALHWHGDTFDIPPGCIRTAGSEACPNQAFEYNGRVVALQFHLESSEESITRLINNCGDEITEGEYIQSADRMREGFPFIPAARGIMDSVLNVLAE